jgi:hypothetical protein
MVILTLVTHVLGDALEALTNLLSHYQIDFHVEINATAISATPAAKSTAAAAAAAAAVAAPDRNHNSS